MPDSVTGSGAIEDADDAILSSALFAEVNVFTIRVANRYSVGPIDVAPFS